MVRCAALLVGFWLWAAAAAAGTLRRDIPVPMVRQFLVGALNWPVDWYHPERGSFTAAYDSDDLDASVLAVGLFGLLPPDDERFASPAARPQIEAWLSTLAAASSDVERHTGARDPGFGQISRSLTRDVAEIRQRFARVLQLDASFA